MKKGIFCLIVLTLGLAGLFGCKDKSQDQEWPQFKAALVARRFVRLVHTCSGGVPHTGPRGC